MVSLHVDGMVEGPHLQLLTIMLFLLTNEAEYAVRFALLAGVISEHRVE